MRTTEEIRASLQMAINDRHFLILDGAMGTMLEQNDYTTSPPLWTASANLDSPDLVFDIHKAYLNAGTDIISTNTFRTARYAFKKVSREEEANPATRKAIEVAKSSIVKADRQIYLAGSLAPLEDCFRPDIIPADDILFEEHTAQCSLLISEGVDFILAETLGSMREASVIAEICSNRDYPFMISLRPTGNSTMQDETPLTDCISRLSKFNPLAILLNCNSPENASRDFQILTEVYPGITGIYTNAPGHYLSQTEWDYPDNAGSRFCVHASRWYEEGAKIIGGCCGTQPSMIRELYQYRQNIGNEISKEG